MLGGKNKQLHRPRRSANGYTIIEVMIVLAVSGVIFLAAVNFVNGKQERTAFSSGVNTMASQIQDVIEQVADGQYNDEPITCGQTGAGTLNITVGTGAAAQGTQPTCVFLGKSLTFASGTTNTFSVYPVAGLRIDGSGNEITNLSSAQATRVGSLITTQDMSQNLSVVGISTGGNYTAARQIAFLQSLGQAGDAAGVLGDGAQTVALYYGANSSNLSSITQSSGISICLTDGTRYGTIDIGLNSNSGGTLNVNVANIGTTACKTS
ncbi:MAG TPA: prepilin-type N-terminal cleavage/methylation domain-containing protein [Candidatus Saccharimonadales bacterium]|nr:prepilin-type N-terminal cleavage/methylation domain-containing protein [Candidatus Saccharimonadales bacterium]